MLGSPYRKLAGHPLCLTAPKPARALQQPGCGQRDHGCWQGLEPKSGPARGAAATKPPCVPAQSHQNTKQHPESICPSLPAQGSSSARAQALPSCLPQVQVPQLGDRATQNQVIEGCRVAATQAGTAATCNGIEPLPCGCWGLERPFPERFHPA